MLNFVQDVDSPGTGVTLFGRRVRNNSPFRFSTFYSLIDIIYSNVSPDNRNIMLGERCADSYEGTIFTL